MDEHDRLGTGPYDVLVVGGGLYGLAVALLGAEQGRRVALIEAGACGQGATAASLRVVHGGIRALKRHDLPGTLRFSQALGEWRRRFPRHIARLPCVLPCGPPGFPSPLNALAAFLAMRLLGGRGDWAPRLLTPSARARLDPWGGLPPVRGLLWHDGLCADPAGLVADMVGRVTTLGGVVGEGMEAVAWIRDQERVAGVEVREARAAGARRTIRARRFVVACGAETPRVLGLPGGMDRPPILTRRWGYNLFFPGIEPPPAAAARLLPAGRLVFAVPLPDGVLAGAGYAAAADEGVGDFRRALAGVYPGLGQADARILQAPLVFPSGAGSDPAFPPAGFWVERAAPGLIAAHGTKFTLAWHAARRVMRELDRA